MACELSRDFFSSTITIRLSSLLAGLLATTAFATQPGQLEPPRYQTTDKFGVNLTTGMVTAHLNTLSIGGEMGLSHSITSHTNSFNFRGWHGYNDAFSGSARYTELGEQVKFPNSQSNGFITTTGKAYVMRVSDMMGSHDFYVKVNGETATNASSVQSNYTYTSLSDTRHTLTVSSDRDYLLWTKQDGTVTRFRRDSYDKAGSSGTLTDITYPNGYKIKIHGNDAVTTNTGYQLKYNYVDDNRSLAMSKRSVTFQSGNNVPNADSLQWSQHNPKTIVAINNAIEHCSTANHATCSLSNSWPTVTFNWPGGMPRAFYIGSSIFSVTDAEGRSTQYHYEAHDLSLTDVNDPNSVNSSLTYGPNTRIAPRLVGIKKADNTNVAYTYEYQNQFSFSAHPMGSSYSWLKTEQGLTKRAITPNGTTNYNLYASINSNQGAPLQNNNSRNLSITVNQVYSNFANTIYKIDDTGKFSLLFETTNYRNFLKRESDSAGPDKEFIYDSRNNLTKIVMNEGEGDETYLEAHFPSTCSNRKTCNQPEWTKDAKGLQTDYTYHSSSGQIASITLPADSNGIRPQTRYKYIKKNARYKISSNNLSTSPDGIWLLDSESYCINSSYNGSNCTENDEVVKKYEYEPSNLKLVGIAIEGDGETLRTCYEYDIYGNRIGEISPKAGLTSCL